MATEKSVASVKPSKGPAKPQTPAQTGGPTPIDKGKKYLGEVWSELKKATWPSREELKAQTQVVLSLLIFLGVFMWLWDTLLGLIFKGIMRLMGVEHGGG